MSSIIIPEAVPVTGDHFDRGGRDQESHRGWLLPLPDGYPRSVHSEGNVTGLQALAGSGRLFGLTGYDSNNAAEYILVFDKDKAPAAAANATIVIVPSSNPGPFFWDGGEIGRWMQRGIYIVASSTAPAYTAVATANMFVDVQYA